MGFFDDLLGLATADPIRKKVGLPTSGQVLKYVTGDYGRRYTEFFGGGNRPVPADSFTDGQDEDAAILDLITGTALPQLKAKLSQQGGQIAPEDLLTMQNIYRLRTGKASNQEQQAFLQSTVGSNFFQRFAAGELDDPEAFAQSQDEWYQAVGPSLSQASAGMVQLDETGAPIDEDLAWFQEQQGRQAEMDQFKYQRESLFGLLDMLPSQARLQVLPMLLEDPTYRRILFGGDEGVGSEIPDNPVFDVLRRTR